MDPFDDIDGIVQVKEEEVSVNDSTMFNRQISDEQSYIESFPPALRQKAAADKSTREKIEASISDTRNELHVIREKLYAARFQSASDSRDSILKSVENYLSEIDRLENKLTKLRERQLEAFVKSLELEDLQISGTKLTRHMKRNRSMVPGATRVESSHMERLLSDGALRQPAGSSSLAGAMKNSRFGRLMSREQLEQTVTPDGGYETRSTYQTQDNSPLLRKTTASPKTFSTPSERKVLDAELAALRGKIYKVSQMKELTPADEDNLRIMTAKLRALKEL